jgi:uncharacterized protein with HEPN domain
MSESGKTEREWRFYLDDMLAFAERAQSYTVGLTLAEFLADERTYDATLRNLELIGESATRIPAEFRDAHPEIAWRQIIAMRNRLIHAYLGIDDDTLWSIIQTDIPTLLAHLMRLRQRFE